ncbi:ABC transporter permease [Streptomyces sp. NBC_00273]|uniref:ABC transporter permease n=1 Tax=Streptomyces sp. NBC_00273 TaxID=2903644 RepID=UPI003FA70EFD
MGLGAGFLGGWYGEITMRCLGVLLAIPPLLLSLALIAALGSGTVNVAITVGLSTVANFARVTRAETLRVCRSGSVEAARSLGAGHCRILVRHVLPHAQGPLLSLLALELGIAILAVSGLSFLGYGADPPTPESGLLVADGRDYVATSWCQPPGRLARRAGAPRHRLSRVAGDRHLALGAILRHADGRPTLACAVGRARWIRTGIWSSVLNPKAASVYLWPGSRPRRCRLRGVARWCGDPRCGEWAALLERPGRVVLRAQER